MITNTHSVGVVHDAVIEWQVKHKFYEALPGEPDVFSSGRFFDGWAGRPPDREAGDAGAVVVRGGWKLSHGWRRRYRALALDDAPSSASVV